MGGSVTYTLEMRLADVADENCGIGPCDTADANLSRIERKLSEQHIEIERLTARQQELLATIVRLTNEVPFPDEVKGWTATRAAMVAEIGTLRSQVDDLTRELAAKEKP